MRPRPKAKRACRRRLPRRLHERERFREQTLTTLGLGTFLTFDARPGDDRRNLGEVFRRYVAGGGRAVDTSPLYGSAEVSVGAFLAGTPEASAQDQLAELVERGSVDFVQTNYSIFNRSAERRLLPAAATRGVGVLINLPLEKARLMKVVEGRSLPDFAREFEAATWAQFFLKWVMAHPAVTTVLRGTSNPEHAEDKVQAMYGPLPDGAMRRRMVQQMETIPGFADIGRMPWYPDKDAQYQGLI